MFFNLTGRLTAPGLQYRWVPPKRRGSPRWRYPLRKPVDPPPPPASQRCLTAPLGSTAIAHSDIAAGFSYSVTSQVAGPSGSISHTAVAVDPVHGSQFTDFASIDNTQADWQAATLTGGHGSSGMGEVCAGMAPTALTGQRGQPADTAGQPNWGMIQL